MSLECCLHFDVPFGGDVECGDKEFLDVFWHFFHALHASFLGNFEHECFAVKSSFFGDGLKDRVDFEKVGFVENFAYECDCEEWFDA